MSNPLLERQLKACSEISLIR